MKNPCKEYHVVLEVLGPVHVGNGRELDKKSYIFTDKKHIAVIDLEKLYAYLSEKKLDKLLHEDIYLCFKAYPVRQAIVIRGIDG